MFTLSCFLLSFILSPNNDLFSPFSISFKFRLPHSVMLSSTPLLISLDTMTYLFTVFPVLSWIHILITFVLNSSPTNLSCDFFFEAMHTFFLGFFLSINFVYRNPMVSLQQSSRCFPMRVTRQSIHCISP